MNKKEILKKNLPFIEAWTEDKVIQYKSLYNSEWRDAMDGSTLCEKDWEHRIKTRIKITSLEI